MALVNAALLRPAERMYGQRCGHGYACRLRLTVHKARLLLLYAGYLAQGNKIQVDVQRINTALYTAAYQTSGQNSRRTTRCINIQ